jgi:hypothetical protein
MTEQLTEQSIVVAVPAQVSADLPDGEVVILNVADGVYYGMNPVGGRIWSLITQPRRVREICDILLDEYDIESEQCMQEVLALLKELLDQGLVQLQDETPG